MPQVVKHGHQRQRRTARGDSGPAVCLLRTELMRGQTATTQVSSLNFSTSVVAPETMIVSPGSITVSAVA
jgi:hypothetical protein